MSEEDDAPVGCEFCADDLEFALSVLVPRPCFVGCCPDFADFDPEVFEVAADVCDVRCDGPPRFKLDDPGIPQHPLILAKTEQAASEYPSPGFGCLDLKPPFSAKDRELLDCCFKRLSAHLKGEDFVEG